MKAARFHGKGDIRIEDIPQPEPPPDKVLIEISWCGICGTDLHEYILGPLVIPGEANPHALTGERMPVVLGHEFTGYVVKTAEGSSLRLGQAVMIDPRLSCSDCYACRSSKPKIDNLCKNFGFLGLSGGGGGFSEFVAVDPKMCYPLPDKAKMDEAALIEPLCVGRHGLTASGIEDFSNLAVLVVGGGPIGLSTLWNLRAVRTRLTIVSEPAEVRRQHTADLADHVFSPADVAVGEECRKLTGGGGVDIVFDCAGIPAGLDTALDALKPRGTYVNVAGWEQPMTVPFHYAMMKELTLKFSLAYNESDFQAVVDDFVEGKFAGVEKMITSRIAVDDIAKLGFEELINNKDQHVKIVATPKHELLRKVQQGEADLADEATT